MIRKALLISFLTVFAVSNVRANDMGDAVQMTPDTITHCEWYEWHGVRYVQSGIYYHHTNEGAASDTLYTLYLTINEATHDVFSSAVCDSTEWHGTRYYAGGTYTYAYTNAYACPSVDTLHLTVNHATHTVSDSTACESLMWHNRRYTASGSYGFSYFNAQRCLSTDTVRLTIVVGTHLSIDTAQCVSFTWQGTQLTSTGTHICRYANADGCESADTVRLTIYPGTFTADSQTVCDSLRWHDTLRTANGTYVFNYLNDNSCNSTDTLHLTVKTSTHNTFDTTVCGGMWWHGSACTHAGRSTYTYPYTNAIGCPSTDTLHLTTYIAHNSLQRTVCDSIRWHDSLYTETGVYLALLFPTDEFCLNNDTLYLMVNHSVHNTEEVTVCESYIWHDTTYIASGEMVYHYKDNHNCDAADTLHLTVNYGTHNTFDTMSCGTLSWSGRRYTTTGTHIFTYINDSSCASADTINLTILPDLHIALDTAVCDSIIWHNVIYTSANIYTYTYADVNNCLTTDTLWLDVDYSYNTSASDTACEYYTWHGVQYSATGIYTHVASLYNACHNTDTLHLVIYPASYLSIYRTACDSLLWNGMMLRASGDTVYHSLTEHFCEIADTLHLTINPSKYTVDTVHGCNSYVWIDGVTYYSSNDTASYTLRTTQQCDSVVTIALTMGQRNTGSDTAVWCDSYSWQGIMGGRDTVVLDTLLNVSLCDSVVSHHMHIKNSTLGHINVIACNSYTWIDGVTYMSDTVTTAMLINNQGCDSTLVMNLTITPEHVITFDANGGTGSIPPARFCETEELVLPRNVFHRQGYAFGGWALSPQADTSYYHDRDTIIVVSDMTLYAYWISNCNEQYGTYLVNGCDSYEWLGNTYYEDTIVIDTAFGAVPGGCDSICTLILTMHRSSRSIDVRHACDSLTWIDGITYTAPVDASEYTAVDTVANAEGCDSIISLHLFLNYSYRISSDTAACDSLLWYDGQMHYADSIVEHVYRTVNDCDSVIEHSLTIHPSYNDSVTAAICAGIPYYFGGDTLTTQGVFDTLFTTVHGCDSAVVLTLTVGMPYDTTITFASCDSLIWNDSTYTVSTTDTIRILNVENCDSTVVINLSILGYASSEEVRMDVCDSLVWLGGIVLKSTTDTSYNTHTLSGCDSTVILHLTVNHSKTRDTAISACGSFLWEGSRLQPSADTYHLNYNGTTAQGCDSIVGLSVKVNQTYSVSIFDTICHGQSVEFHGNTYTQAGSYPHTLSSVDGCDSTLVLELYVLRYIADTQSLSACDSLVWNGTTYYSDATASRFVENPGGCDSVHYMQLHVAQTYIASFDTAIYDTTGGFEWHGYYCDHTGDYTFIFHSIDGCDSTVVMHLTVIETQDTTHQGIQLLTDNDTWTIYPNPTRGFVTLQGESQLSSVELFDVAGRRLFIRKGDIRQLDLSSVPEGTYILRLTTAAGNTHLCKLIRQR